MFVLLSLFSFSMQILRKIHPVCHGLKGIIQQQRFVSMSRPFCLTTWIMIQANINILFTVLALLAVGTNLQGKTVRERILIIFVIFIIIHVLTMRIANITIFITILFWSPIYSPIEKGEWTYLNIRYDLVKRNRQWGGLVLDDAHDVNISLRSQCQILHWKLMLLLW